MSRFARRYFEMGTNASECQAMLVATPLRVPDGSKLIEEFQVGDLVLARDEHDPNGDIVPKVVEEVFKRFTKIVELRIAGHTIRTTPEHPFWFEGRGWCPIHEGSVGDRLLTMDGQYLPIESLVATDEWEVVYNLRIADYHTYFVGCDDWGFSVWAHNAEYEVRLHEGKWTLFEKGQTEPVMWDPRTGKTGPRTFETQQEGIGAIKKIEDGANPQLEIPKSRQRNGKRREYLGENARKGSSTYNEVVDRMRQEGKIVGEGAEAKVKTSDGMWLPLDSPELDLVHLEDAVAYWNTTGKYWGAKHPEVRKWMTDQSKYTIDVRGPNRSGGATLGNGGTTYDLPDPRPGGPPK